VLFQVRFVLPSGSMLPLSRAEPVSHRLDVVEDCSSDLDTRGTLPQCIPAVKSPWTYSKFIRRLGFSHVTLENLRRPLGKRRK
jgi:hypothetical protein